ncbi:hypothetical protein ACJX0J_026384, partial [Zea mays]
MNVFLNIVALLYLHNAQIICVGEQINLITMKTLPPLEIISKVVVPVILEAYLCLWAGITPNPFIFFVLHAQTLENTTEEL